MKKNSTVNTFQDGLIMDLNPLLTPNSALTNCLNGTIVTFNGNENVLQNDMGNGRVETAYLPQGYVPLGTAELGGIIYIVSYNPLINKCQIGCFPSPERNITSDEIKQGSNCSVSNSNFRDKNNDITTTEYKVELLPDNMKLNPGDQYSIYSTNKGITNNFHTLSFIGNTEHNMNNTDSQIYKNVEIHVISISDDGKITYLDDSVKWFENTFVGITKEPGETQLTEKEYRSDYYIREVDSANDETINTNINTDIDNYRSLVSSAYNIFNSKTSGKLALLFKLNVIDTFSATWECFDIQDTKFTKKDGTEGINREVKIDFNINYTSQHSTINPNCIISNITKSGDIKCKDKDDKDEKEIQLSEVNWMNIDIPENRKNDGTDSNISVPLSKYTKDENNKVTSTRLTFVCEDFDKSKNYQLVCKLTPSMSFGNLPYLSQTLTINLEKINSGEIEINDWRYYVTSKEAIINFNLDAYPKAKQKIEEIKLKFLPPQFLWISEKSNDNGYREYTSEKIGGAIYYDKCDKIIQVGKIQSGQYQTKLTLGDIYPKNCLFLVDIILKISKEGKYSYYHYSKFLYTCGIFNDEYYSGKNFDKLCIDDYLKPTMECVLSNNILNQTSSVPDDIDGILGHVSSSEDYANGTMCAQTTNINDTSDFECNIVDENHPDSFIYESEIETNVKVKDIRYINNEPISDTKYDKNGRDEVQSIKDENPTSIELLNGIIKTLEENNKYKDCFSPRIYNNKIDITGVIYSRINALVENKTVTSQNCLRPVLYTIYDLDSLGLQKYDDGNINFKYSFVMESGDHGGGDDFKLTMRKYSITSTTFPNEFAGASQNFYMMDEVETGKDDFGGDGSFTKNWNQVNKFKNQAVQWMEETGNLFAFWQFNYRSDHKHQRKWKDGTGCRNTFESYSNNRQYANLFMIRGKNDMFYPMNYFMGYNYQHYQNNSDYVGAHRKGSNEFSKVVIALLTQLYYVQKGSETSMTTPRVTNINYVNDYNVELELEFSKKIDSISAKIKSYTDEYGNTIETYELKKQQSEQSEQSKYPNIYVKKNIKNITGSYTKNYFINNDELYEKYSSNKSLICSCIAKTGYGNYTVNANQEGVLYTPKCFEGVSTTEFIPSFNKNGTLYINTELQINEETGVITMKFPSNENTERITDELMSSLRIDSDYKLYADDSKILKNNSDMRCAEYSAQSTDFNIKFKGNSSVKVYLGQNIKK